MKNVCIAIALVIGTSLCAFGQSATPEFELRLHLSGDINTDPVGFGYDPRASMPSDTSLGYDSAFGEMYYPSSPFSGDEFLAFEIDSVGDYAEIDILPKPLTDTFILQYTIFVSTYNSKPATLSWSGSITPQVKGIIVKPTYHPETFLVDMTKQTSVTLSNKPSDLNYFGNWEPATITVYYNTSPPAMDVSPSAQAGTTPGLIYGLSVYPNPVRSSGNLSFSLADEAQVKISAFDQLGRLLFLSTANGHAGSNTIDLSKELDAVQGNGNILLRLDAVNGDRQETKTLIIVKE